MGDLENSLMSALIPIFPQVPREILTLSVNDPSNRQEGLIENEILQLCIDDVLEMRTYTCKILLETNVVKDFNDASPVNDSCVNQQNSIESKLGRRQADENLNKIDDFSVTESVKTANINDLTNYVEDITKAAQDLNDETSKPMEISGQFYQKNGQIPLTAIDGTTSNPLISSAVDTGGFNQVKECMSVTKSDKILDISTVLNRAMFYQKRSILLQKTNKVLRTFSNDHIKCLLLLKLKEGLQKVKYEPNEYNKCIEVLEKVGKGIDIIGKGDLMSNKVDAKIINNVSVKSKNTAGTVTITNLNPPKRRKTITTYSSSPSQQETSLPSTTDGSPNSTAGSPNKSFNSTKSDHSELTKTKKSSRVSRFTDIGHKSLDLDSELTKTKKASRVSRFTDIGHKSLDLDSELTKTKKGSRVSRFTDINEMFGPQNGPSLTDDHEHIQPSVSLRLDQSVGGNDVLPTRIPSAHLHTESSTLSTANKSLLTPYEMNPIIRVEHPAAVGGMFTSKSKQKSETKLAEIEEPQSATAAIVEQLTAAQPVNSSSINLTDTDVIHTMANGDPFGHYSVKDAVFVAPEPAQETSEAAVNRKTNEVLEFFPDAQPQYIREQLLYRSKDELCNFLLENKDYPKIEKQIPRKKILEELERRNAENQKKVSIDYYNFDSRVSSMYAAHSLCLLRNQFQTVALGELRRIHRKFNFHYAATRRALLNGFKDADVTVNQMAKAGGVDRIAVTIPIIGPVGYSESKTPVLLIRTQRCKYHCTHTDPDLQAELEYIEKAENDVAIVKEEVAEEDYVDESQLIECGCCFSDVAFEKMIQCYEGHLFCKECLKRYAEESVYGHGKVDLVCMTDGCDATYPLDQIKAALPESILVKYHERIRDESINLANLDDLVGCPHCDFKAVLDPGDKVFKCLNPECMMETCRYCKEDWVDHFGKRCDEIEKSDEVSLRTSYEEKMSLAMIRICHQCKANFTKSEGCNKMTCRCKAKMCYICRAPNIEYSHFCQHPLDPGKPCKSCKACSLWSNPEEDEKRAIEELKKEANKARLDKGFDDDKEIGVPCAKKMKV